MEASVNRGSSQEWGHLQEQSWKMPFGIRLLGGHQLPYQRVHGAHDLVVSVQTTKMGGAQPQQSAGNFTKALLSKALPTRARSTFSTCSSHQEAYTSFLASSTRRQIGEARRTMIPQQLKQKSHCRKVIRMKKQCYVPDERTR